MVAPGMVAYDNPPLAHARPATLDYRTLHEAGIERFADMLTANLRTERPLGGLR